MINAAAKYLGFPHADLTLFSISGIDPSEYAATKEYNDTGFKGTIEQIDDTMVKDGGWSWNLTKDEKKNWSS